MKYRKKPVVIDGQMRGARPDVVAVDEMEEATTNEEALIGPIQWRATLTGDGRLLISVDRSAQLERTTVYPRNELHEIRAHPLRMQWGEYAGGDPWAREINARSDQDTELQRERREAIQRAFTAQSELDDWQAEHEDYVRVVLERIKNGEQIPERPASLSWLYGPEEK